MKRVDALLKHLNCSGYVVVFEHNIRNPLTKKIVTAPGNEADDIHWMSRPAELKQLFQKSGIETRIVWKGYPLFSASPAMGYKSRESPKTVPFGRAAAHRCAKTVVFLLEEGHVMKRNPGLLCTGR